MSQGNKRRDRKKEQPHEWATVLSFNKLIGQKEKGQLSGDGSGETFSYKLPKWAPGLTISGLSPRDQPGLGEGS